MAQRRQRGWPKKEIRTQGETWVLYFRTTRKFDGRRVENKIPIGFVRDFPDKSSAWAEVERLHLALNPVDSRQGVTFADLAQHYAEHELVDRSASITRRTLEMRSHSEYKFSRNEYTQQLGDSSVRTHAGRYPCPALCKLLDPLENSCILNILELG